MNTENGSSIWNEDMDLPKFVVIKSLSNENYLCPSGINRYMKFEADDVTRWGVKHKVEKAKCGGGLVHIRCCDTGSYWTWGVTEDTKKFLTAQADQPEEGTTTNACTLIKPSHNTKDGVNIVNIELMDKEVWWSVGGNEGAYLIVGNKDFIISNWELLPPNQPQRPSVGDKIMNTGGISPSIENEEIGLPRFEEEMDLPKFVVFNSLLNKNYLCPEKTTGYMKFQAVDALSWGVKHEVQKANFGVGLVHIRCCDIGKYWSWGLMDYTKWFIVAEANQPEEDTTVKACTLIKYIKCGVSVVNLQVMFEGTWRSVGEDGGPYLVTGGENFFISNWELLAPEQSQGPYVDDKYVNIGDGASISNEEMDLPKFVVVKSPSNEKYLRPGGINRYMKLEADDVTRWGVKHQVEKAKCGGGLVHIRCCDTGKYWTWGRTNDSVDYITSQADQPGEDTTKGSCTLIQPSHNTKDGVNVVNLMVSDGKEWWQIGGNKGGYLVMGDDGLIISNWELLPLNQQQGQSVGEKIINTRGIGASIGNEKMVLPKFEEEMDLPKFVVFNSLFYKNYLCPDRTTSYMKFEAVDVLSWGVKHEVQKAKFGVGLVHIRCCDTGKYWSWGLTDYTKWFIVAEANQPEEDRTTRACTLIKPTRYTKDGVNVVNLQVMFEGTWRSIGGDGGTDLVTGGEDFIISNWEVLQLNLF